MGSHPGADWTPLQQAAWLTVHEFRGHGPGTPSGARALAAATGKSAGTISNEVNPDVLTHKLGLEDATLYQLLSHDHRMLHAQAATLHEVCVPLPDFSRVSDVELLTAYADWQAFIGQTCGAVRDALADHRIERHEVEEIRQRGNKHVQRFFEFMSRLEALIDE